MILRYFGKSLIIILLICLIGNACSKSKAPDQSTVKIKEDERREESGEEVQGSIEEQYLYGYLSRRSQAFSYYPDPDDQKLKKAIGNRRIMGGSETSVTLYPFMVAIVRDGRCFCGGSVMDEQWVLTAAHCIDPVLDNNARRLARMYVRAGSSVYNRGGYRTGLNKVFLADTSWDPGSSDYDWAMIRLDRPLPFGRKISVVNLPKPGMQPPIGELMAAMGWGSTQKYGDGVIPENLRFAPLISISNKECQNGYKWWILPLTNRMMCAGYLQGGRSICAHDTGGPLYHKGLQVGIASVAGMTCGEPKKPGVFSKTEQMSWWALHLMPENEAFREKDLKPRIDQWRKLEIEIHNFTVKVQERKEAIKVLLTALPLSYRPIVDVVKEKARDAGIVLDTSTRRPRPIGTYAENLDEINLANLIHDRVIYEDSDMKEVFLSALALDEILKAEKLIDLLPSAGIEKLNIIDIIVTR